jgi:hypothetical protein
MADRTTPAAHASEARATDEATIMAWADDYLATNDEPCRFDHHGGCQEHGYLSLEPGERCPQGAAIEAHRRLAYGVAEERA